jgi:hypothetical protein
VGELILHYDDDDNDDDDAIHNNNAVTVETISALYEVQHIVTLSTLPPPPIITCQSLVNVWGMSPQEVMAKVGLPANADTS